MCRPQRHCMPLGLHALGIKKTAKAEKLALFWSYTLYSTMPLLLEDRAARSIGSDVNTNAGINSCFLSCILRERHNEVEHSGRR